MYYKNERTTHTYKHADTPKKKKRVKKKEVVFFMDVYILERDDERSGWMYEWK